MYVSESRRLSKCAIVSVCGLAVIIPANINLNVAVAVILSLHCKITANQAFKPNFGVLRDYVASHCLKVTRL